MNFVSTVSSDIAIAEKNQHACLNGEPEPNTNTLPTNQPQSKCSANENDSVEILSIGCSDYDAVSYPGSPSGHASVSDNGELFLQIHNLILKTNYKSTVPI